MLDELVAALVCPYCREPLTLMPGNLRCPNGHHFDIARQGYANLLPGDAQTGTADTAAMVEARDTFLGEAHFAPIERALAEVAVRLLADGPEGCVVDVGAGTGRYLAAVLDAVPGRLGLALDISKFAARRAAKAHPRIAAVVCDAWRPLPVRTASAALVLDVFAPRNAAEFARVLASGGALVVVTPTARHLGELIGPLGMLTVDPLKAERLAEGMADRFTRVESIEVEEPMALDRADVAAVVAMGPSARHSAPGVLASRIADLPEPVEVTVSVTVSVYRPLDRNGA